MSRLEDVRLLGVRCKYLNHDQVWALVLSDSTVFLWKEIGCKGSWWKNASAILNTSMPDPGLLSAIFLSLRVREWVSLKTAHSKRKLASLSGHMGKWCVVLFYSSSLLAWIYKLLSFTGIHFRCMFMSLHRITHEDVSRYDQSSRRKIWMHAVGTVPVIPSIKAINAVASPPPRKDATLLCCFLSCLKPQREDRVYMLKRSKCASTSMSLVCAFQ